MLIRLPRRGRMSSAEEHESVVHHVAVQQAEQRHARGAVGREERTEDAEDAGADDDERGEEPSPATLFQSELYTNPQQTLKTLRKTVSRLADVNVVVVSGLRPCPRPLGAGGRGRRQHPPQRDREALHPRPKRLVERVVRAEVGQVAVQVQQGRSTGQAQEARAEDHVGPAEVHLFTAAKPSPAVQIHGRRRSEACGQKSCCG